MKPVAGSLLCAKEFGFDGAGDVLQAAPARKRRGERLNRDFGGKRLDNRGRKVGGGGRSLGAGAGRK